MNNNNINFRLIGMGLLLLAAVAWSVAPNTGSGACKQNASVMQEVEAAVQSLDNLEELAW